MMNGRRVQLPSLKIRGVWSSLLLSSLRIQHCHCCSWVAAMVQVPSLARELPHVMGMAKKKKKSKKKKKKRKEKPKKKKKNGGFYSILFRILKNLFTVLCSTSAPKMYFLEHGFYQAFGEKSKHILFSVACIQHNLITAKSLLHITGPAEGADSIEEGRVRW